MADINQGSASDTVLGPTLDDLLKLPEFEYRKLPTPMCIRLLEILPSRPGVIRCAMHGLVLEDEAEDDEDEPLSYIALSYTWGNPITVYEEPAPSIEGFKMPEDYEKLPWVFSSRGPGRSTFFNVDYAKRDYIANHPWIPHERVDSQNTSLKPIEINGCLTHVQENLHRFLDELVHMKYVSNLGKTDPVEGENNASFGYLNWAVSAPIWIDSICINQNDLAERASQVQLMGRIYRKAHSIFAWLGPKDSFTYDAVQSIDTLSKLDPEFEGSQSLSSIPDMDLVSWFSLFAFFQRLWFRRAWITQEAIFGSRLTVFCEAGIIPWRILESAVNTLERTGLGLQMAKMGRNLLTSQPLSENTRQMRNLSRLLDDYDDSPKLEPAPEPEIEPGDALTFIRAVQHHRLRLRAFSSKDNDKQNKTIGQPSLLSVLSLFRNTSASDPRDKVFAFLNLASDTFGVLPEYRASVQSVFINTTEAIIRETKSLSILSQVQEPCDTLIENLPGWVPDFSCRLRSTPFDSGDDDIFFRASGMDTEAHFEINSDGTLEVDGIQVGNVSESPDFEKHNDFQSVLLAIVRTPLWYPILVGGETCTPSSDEDKDKDVFDVDENKPRINGRRISRMEALWRTLVCDTSRDSNGVQHPAPQSMGRGFSNWILVHLLEAWYLFQDLDSSDDKLGSIGKLAAKNLFNSLAIWGLLYEGKHVPLTDDTVGFSAKIPDVAAMAAAEEGKIESESGSVNSKPSYLPSASRVQAYLHRKRPERVPAKEGYPQAAIHGQWRHAALMQFTEEARVEIFGFEKAMRAKMTGRRLFSTVEGLLGLGPRSLFYEGQIHYRVFILKGTKVPYILKRLGNGTYRLVGEAYIHGIMHGEAIATLERASSDRSWCQRINLA